MQTKPFQTKLRKLGTPIEGVCYPCKEPGLHAYWCPESNGLICEDCLTEFIAAERVLNSIPGICRPHIPDEKAQP